MMMAASKSSVRFCDVTLRDGSHAMGQRFSRDQVTATVDALERAGVRSIEVGHGDGLGGSSFNYGFSALSETELLEAAVDTCNEATISCVVLPGIGTSEHLREAADLGAKTLRVATHCTEADIGIEHIEIARGLDLDVAGFLMMSHMISGPQLARQAQIMASAGADCVYLADSAGAMLPADASERVAALREELDDRVEVGFHAHHNLSLGVAVSLAAVEAGATRIDGSLAGLGAGAGNAPTELIAAAFAKAGIETGVDVAGALDAAEDVVRPYMRHEPRCDRSAVMLGYAGVYSSFLLHAQRAADRYGVRVEDVLAEAGRLSLVGGQEDILIEIALGLAADTEPAAGLPN